MREILFKAKRKDNGKWVEGYYATIHAGCLNGLREPIKEEKVVIISHMKNNGMIFDEVDPETVCQYTGLDDKNGKKIFEGDILQYFDNEMQVVEWSDEYGQMMLHTYSEHERKKGRKVTKKITDGWNYLDDYPLSDMPILGNIFDNPELLECF